MLPVTTGHKSRSNGDFAFYLRRLLKPKHMDWQYTMWTMLQLIISPKTVYRQTSYHKHTSGGWARDDPAFLVLSTGAVAVLSFIWALLFSDSFAHSLSIVFLSIFWYYLGIGCTVATGSWFVSNKLLQRRSPHPHSTTTDSSAVVEWLYCWDVHCNGLVPLVALLGVVQLLLSPVFLLDSRLAAALSCLMYCGGLIYYFYITFLGFAAIPYLERPETFLYPLGALVLALPIAFLIGFNPTKYMLRIYFGYT